MFEMLWVRMRSDVMSRLTDQPTPPPPPPPPKKTHHHHQEEERKQRNWTRKNASWSSLIWMSILDPADFFNSVVTFEDPRDAVFDPSEILTSRSLACVDRSLSRGSPCVGLWSSSSSVAPWRGRGPRVMTRNDDVWWRVMVTFGEQQQCCALARKRPACDDA